MWNCRRSPGEPGTYPGQIIGKREPDSSADARLYLRLSMGDYAIVCSGAAISEADLRKKLNGSVTLRGKIKLGEARGMADSGEFLLVTKLVD